MSTAAAPPRRPRLQAELDLSKGVRWSLAGHALLAALFLLKNLVFPGKPALYVPTLRVDIVGLPDVLKKDLANIPRNKPSQEILDALKKAEESAKKIKPSTVKLPPPEQKAEKDEMVLHPKQMANPAARERKLKSALERIKSLEKIEDRDTDSKPVVVKGNRVSKGTSLTGDAKEAAEASYFDQLRDRLQENWALPVWVARQNLSAQVQVFIDAHGRLRNFRFVKNSGNPQFDEAIKKTLSDSQPFPIPPEGLADSLLDHGVLVGFPL
jgi:TonB family protein